MMTNLVMAVPVTIPTFSGSEAQRHWAMALGAFIFVVSAAVVLAGTSRLRARRIAAGLAPAPRALPALRLEKAPVELVWTSAAVSVSLFLIALSRELPEWATALFILTPWLPVLAIESAHRWRRDAFYTLFLIVALLQAGHMGEHSAQVFQLVMHKGDLMRSHGVFGDLDFETVHFFWDTLIWIITAMMIYRYSTNGWLWLAFGFASLHQVEHTYLYTLYLTDFEYYMRGGLAGIMGKGGVVGSPFARPYLHFLYNFLVTAPMLIGVWSQHLPSRGAAPDADR
jgi:hypothetical protein